MKALRLLMIMVSLLTFTALAEESQATEIVAANTDKGLLVVADKRITYPDGSRKSHDNGRKVMLARPYLVAVCGYLNLVAYVRDRSGKSKSIDDFFDSIGVCAQTIHRFGEARITEEAVAREVTADAGRALFSADSFAPMPVSIRNRLLFSVLFAKADPRRKCYQLLNSNYSLGNMSDGTSKVDCNFVASEMPPGRASHYILGSPWIGLENVNKLQSPYEFDRARAWAENEILTSYKKVRLNGQTVVGNIVDEYLVLPDGGFKILASQKQLPPRH